MSQHDYVLDNAAGASFRTDLNNALSAIVSQNSGASEPTTTFAYQYWADTTNNLLKQRNSANNAWIIKGTLDGLLNGIDNYVDKNPIINGDFNFWQEGTTGFGNNDKFADLWKTRVNSNIGIVAVTRDTSVPTVAESGHLSNYSMKVAVTTADTTQIASEYILIRHVIEGYNFLPIAQQEFTISFWVRSSETGIYYFGCVNSGDDRSYFTSYTINTADTWEYKTLTIPASPSTGTWNYTNGQGLEIQWALSVASDFHGTADTWLSAHKWAASDQINWLGQTAATFHLSQVKIDKGKIALPFTGIDYQEELQLINRYYFNSKFPTISSSALTAGAFVGMAESATIIGGFRFPVPMRTTPTVTLWDTGGTSGRISKLSSGTVTGGVSAANIHNSGVLNLLGSALVTGILYRWHAEADARL